MISKIDSLIIYIHILLIIINIYMLWNKKKPYNLNTYFMSVFV